MKKTMLLNSSKTSTVATIAAPTDGDDTITGSKQADLIDGGLGNDSIKGGSGNDTVIGGEGNDRLLGDGGADSLIGDNGDDSIEGGAGNDSLFGGDGIDYLNGGLGNDLLDGGIGNDLLLGEAGKNTLIGGTGDDTMVGGTVADLFRYNLGDGSDIIDTKGGTDVLAFGEGITAADLEFGHNTETNALQIRVVSTGDIILASFHFDSTADNNVDKITFADGSSLTAAQIATRATHYFGTSASEIMFGGQTGVQFTGGEGNDTIVGGAGNDRFNYNIGDGSDIIDTKGGTDVLAFGEGITAADLEFGRNPETNALQIRIASTGDIILASYHFDGSADNNIDQITFADGSSLTAAQIANLATHYFGTSASETLIGGQNGVQFTGGEGNDTIIGGAGDDRFSYSVGDGNDVIFAKAGVDTLRFTDDTTATDLLFTHDGATNNLIITHTGSGETITVAYHFYGESEQLDAIQFADGSSLTLAQIASLAHRIDGTAGDDLLVGWSEGSAFHGGAGNDTLAGGSGDDSFNFAAGDGNDFIFAKAGVDTLRFTDGTTAADLVFAHDGATNNLLITHLGSGETITVAYHFYGEGEQLDAIQFADGSSLTLAQIDSLAHPILGTADEDVLYALEQGSLLRGLGGNDVLYGGSGADTLDGGAGIDYLLAGDGADTFLFRAASDSDFNYPDIIVDFNQAAGDKIDLRAISTDFTFLGDAAYTGTANELHFRFDGLGNTLLEADLDGDGQDDVRIQLTGEITLTANDFIV